VSTEKLAALSLVVENVLDDLIEVGNGMVLDEEWRHKDDQGSIPGSGQAV
jgi:hypothetical protein